MDAGSIYVKIGAKLEPLDKAMREVNTKLKKFETKTATLAKKTEKLANTIIKRTALITAAIAGVSTAAVKVAGDFERAMVRVASVSQATGRQMGQLRKAALDLAGATEYTGRQVAEGMGFLAMAGFKVEQTIGAMPSVLQLATAGMMDLGTAADITTNILTGYGMEVDDLAKVNDILVSAMTGANVDLRMLGESFKYAGPVVKGAGIAFEEAAAAIALMGNAGIQGSMAGTSLRTAVSRLLNPSKQAQRILGRLGVQTKDATGKLRSLTTIITELERAGATTADMMALFGDRAGPAMAALVEQGSGALREFTARLRDSEGIAGKIERDMLNTWPGMWNVLKGQIEGVAITIGDDLLPYAKTVVTIAGDIVAKFQGLDKEQRMQILRWVGLAGAVVGVIAAFGLLVAGASLVMKGLAMLGGVLGFLTSPMVLLIGLIVTAIGVLYTAWAENWGGIRTKTEEVWAIIEPIFQDMWGWLKRAWEWAIDVAGAAWDWFTNTTWTEKWDGIKAWMQKGWDWLINLTGDGWAWLKEKAPWATSVIETAWEWTLDFLGAAWTWLKDTAWPWLSKTAETGWNWTAELAGDVWDWLKDTAWPWLSKTARTTWNWFADLVPSAWVWLRTIAWPWLTNTAWTAWEWTARLAGTAWAWLKDTAWPWIANTAKTAWEWTASLWGATIAWIKNTAWPWLTKNAETLWKWSADLVGDLIVWIKDTAWPWINDTVKTTWEWTVKGLDWLKELLNIGKGQKVDIPFGDFMGKFNISESDRTLLARIAQAEAAVDGLNGMVMVVQTIMNRMEKHPDFYGRTVEEVVFKPGAFEPVATGALDAIVEPTEKAVTAVNIALSELAAGIDRTAGALYFANLDIVKQRNPRSWMLDPERFQPTGQYGGHTFGTRGPQWSSGTPWTGHGPLDEVAGVVHRREAVIPWDALRKGPAGVLEFLGVPGFRTGRKEGALSSLAAVDPGLAKDLEDQQTMLNKLTDSLMKIPEMLMEGIVKMFELLGTALTFAVEKLLGEEKAQEMRQALDDWLQYAKDLVASFSQTSEDAEEVGKAIAEATKPDLPAPELTRWQKFTLWLGEQIDQINAAVENIDWGKTIQTGLDTVTARLQEADSVFAQFMGDLVSHIKVGMDEAGQIMIDWSNALASMLNATIALVAESLTSLLLNEYGSQFRGLTKQGKETFPDLGAMVKNYGDWDKNMAKLKDAQRSIDRNTVAGAGIGAALGYGIGTLIGGPLAGAIIGGFLGGTGARRASQQNYAKEIAELQEKLQDTWQSIKEALGTTVTDIADSLAKAFSADTYEDFVAGFAQSVEDHVRNALITVFMSEQLMDEIKDLSEYISVAALDYTIDPGERDTIIDLYSKITDKSSAFYDALHNLGIATEDVAEKMGAVSESLRNVPAGFKIATRRFQSASPVPLAEGGIVTRPTLALVGESGPEAVIPLDGGGSGITVEVTVNGSIYADDFDDRVSRAVAKGARKAGLGRYGLAGGRA